MLVTQYRNYPIIFQTSQLFYNFQVTNLALFLFLFPFAFYLFFSPSYLKEKIKMTDIENKQELTESSPSLPSPVMTDSDSESNNTKQPSSTVEEGEKNIIPDFDQKDEQEEPAAILATTQEEDEFSDAVDEMNIKTANDLSKVISELQGTVIANIPYGKEDIDLSQDQDQEVSVKQLEPNDVLDTIPEDELGSSLINNNKEEESPKEADIDIDLTAASEPNSPRPAAAKDLQIATHFEQIRNSIDVPAGQNMADFVTPPTPGVAPPSLLGGDDQDDDNDDDLPTLNTTESDGAAIVAAGAAIAAVNKEEEVKSSATNAITLSNIDFSTVKPNFLTPRAQEKFGKMCSSLHK
jgi:hypothetical protein